MFAPNAVPHLKMVVIGRSGSGKTTFINSLVNHFFELGYEEERLIAITQTLQLQNSQGCINTEELSCNIKEFENRQSESGDSQAQSQTTIPNIYDLESPHLKLTLVDTPGLGDTRGIVQDQANIKQIAAAVAALTDFNAVLLVHKSTDCRKDVVLSYLLKEFQGMLPRDCKDNMLVAFTAVQNPQKIDAIPALKQMQIPISQNLFWFENNCLIPPSMFFGTAKPDKASQQGRAA